MSNSSVSSSSSSSSSSSAPAYTWGEEFPDGFERRESWQTWKNDTDDSTVTIDGDQEWGRINLDFHQIARGQVIYVGTPSLFWRFVISPAKYGVVLGTSRLLIRGSTTVFEEDSQDISFEFYTGPIFRNWGYVQIGVEGLLS